MAVGDDLTNLVGVDALAESRLEVGRDPIEVDGCCLAGAAEERVDAVCGIRRHRIPDLASYRFAAHDAVGKQGLHVVADGRLTQTEFGREPPDEHTTVGGGAHEAQDAGAGRVAQ